MKGIVLAGGYGTRLRPLTNVTNKHLLPVYNKPMIFYPLETLGRMGITETLVVTGEEFSGHFLELLKDGKDFGMRLEYAVQKGAGGIADALKLGEDFADGGKVAVILGDNIFEDDFLANRMEFDGEDLNVQGDVTIVTDNDTSEPTLTEARITFDREKNGSRLFFKKVSDPERFGVPHFDEDDSILHIEEKPKIPKSSFAVTGLYFYDARVFSIIKEQRPSARGEFEITDVNNAYIKDKTMAWSEVKGFWSDAGTFESLYNASTWARNTYGAR
ncbi:MAG: sugar phosphate nucleotidyltransferase [bacterium]|nr:sugar phosphate nucleotidyltransferase [bacterium]